MERHEVQAIVDDIRTLYSLCVPIEAIARKVHLPVRLIRHVIDNGQFPALEPQWTNEAATPPNVGEVTFSESCSESFEAQRTRPTRKANHGKEEKKSHAR